MVTDLYSKNSYICLFEYCNEYCISHNNSYIIIPAPWCMAVKDLQPEPSTLLWSSEGRSRFCRVWTDNFYSCLRDWVGSGGIIWLWGFVASWWFCVHCLPPQQTDLFFLASFYSVLHKKSAQHIVLQCLLFHVVRNLFFPGHCISVAAFCQHISSENLGCIEEQGNGMLEYFVSWWFQNKILLACWKLCVSENENARQTCIQKKIEVLYIIQYFYIKHSNMWVFTGYFYLCFICICQFWIYSVKKCVSKDQKFWVYDHTVLDGLVYSILLPFNRLGRTWHLCLLSVMPI